MFGMDFIEEVITMWHPYLYFLCIAVGFVIGILVGRKNVKSVENTITKLKSELDAAKAAYKQ